MQQNPTNNTYERFYVYGTVYSQMEGQQKSLMYQRAKVYVQRQQQYYYNIVILNCNDNNDQKVYKLQVDYQAYYDIVKDQSPKLSFYLPIKKNQNLVIEVLFEESMVQRLGQFREVYCRAVFEEKQEQSSRNLSSDELDKEVFIYMQKQNQQVNQSSQLQKLEQELNKEKSFVFFGIGYLATGNDYQDPSIIVKPAVFSIKMDGFNKYKIIIFDESQTIKYSKQIDFLLQRQIEEIDLSFMWIDDQFNKEVPQIYYFQFEQGNVNLKKLESVLQRMDYETDRNTQYNLNNDFEQYYGGSINPGIYHNYQQPQNQNFQFYTQQNNPNESVLDVNNDFIKEFQQLKTKNKILINKNDGLEIVDNQQLQVQQDFQLRDQNNNIFQPDNIHMLDHDNKFISQGNHKQDSVFYTDLNQEKVIREYKDTKGNIQDLTAYGGKEAVFGNNDNFLTLSNQNITQFDPRQAKPVKERFYKTVKNLTNIYAPQEGQYVIASSNGDLRTYDKVGGNARNLIPSYTQSKPLQIDSDKTGHLILVTYETHLQLLPMKQDGQSAFKKTFKKNEKPKPFNLKISPKILAKYGMSKPKFKSAKFDEKLNQNESAIIAVCGKLQVFWNLNDVLRGDTITHNVQQLNEEILNSEFQFNGDKTFTAFKKKLVLSKVGSFN